MSADTHLETSSTSLLQPGKTCWRTERATRATLLIDGEEYFAALRAAMLRARRQILIAGWDFDSRIKLPRNPHDDSSEAPEELSKFFDFLLRTRSELEIHVVRWDYHWFYSDDREAQTRARLERIGVHFHDDGGHPVTGCVHHKVVVIDGALAFCGGIDMTHKRWDTSAHRAHDERRRDPDGQPYIPVHDTQLCVSGPIALALGEYLRDNWPVTAPALMLAEPSEELWPDNVPVDFRNVSIGISRTLPPTPSRCAVREIENFYLAAIQQTERTLYVENQYFTSTRIAAAIAARWRARPELEGLLVGMDRPKSPAELHTMGYGRSTFCKLLAEANVLDRVPLVAALSGAASINLHSKLAVFDDRWLTVGSANLNRRSMGFDVECNLIIEASTAEHRTQIERTRNRLLAEHLGMTSNEVHEAVKAQGLQHLPDLVRRKRRLVRIQPRSLQPNLGPILAPIFDPEEPWAPLAKAASQGGLARWHVVLLLFGAIAAAAMTGHYIHDDLASVNSVQQLIQSFLTS